MIGCVMALEAALLPCLPARELQAIDRSPHPSHQIDVERHARDFMEAAKKLQLYFIGLQREDKPTMSETLRKDIAMMEEELKVKDELIKKQERLIQGWRKELKDQAEKHNTELERSSGSRYNRRYYHIQTIYARKRTTIKTYENKEETIGESGITIDFDLLVEIVDVNCHVLRDISA
ncbi:hypothetical protein SADUNF_Sadunf14G0095200 [Salix dunnii]|uniref:Mediator of RNA polymerase II transcription subunit 28 n=1 Tax=Salix dunnii TaxID=1413687 RepID=A0A835MME5_9ROSI|nr:hypothetical protein SADUNF_Sadunf14G0095200 [Salix dunnii]